MIYKRILLFIRRNLLGVVFNILITTVLLISFVLSNSAAKISEYNKNELESQMKLYCAISTKDPRYWFESDYLKLNEKYQSLKIEALEFEKNPLYSIRLSLSPIKPVTITDGFITKQVKIGKFDDESEAIEYYENEIAKLTGGNNFSFLGTFIDGVNSEQIIYQYTGLVSITEGNSISEENINNGDWVCLLPENSYYVCEEGIKPIRINDVIEFNTVMYKDNQQITGEKYLYKVIGFYNCLQPIKVGSSYGHPVIAPLKCVEQMEYEVYRFVEETGWTTGRMYSIPFLQVSSIVYPTDTFQHVEDFYSKFKKINNDRFTAFTNINEYSDEVSIFEALGKSLNTISYLSLAVILIGLAININRNMKSRSYEFKTLYLLNETRKNIIIQFVMENFLNIVFSLVLAFIIGYCILGYINNMLNISSISLKQILTDYWMLSLVIIFYCCAIAAFFVDKNLKE